jgi:hypothetical protein
MHSMLETKNTAHLCLVVRLPQSLDVIRGSIDAIAVPHGVQEALFQPMLNPVRHRCVLFHPVKAALNPLPGGITACKKVQATAQIQGHLSQLPNQVRGTE